MNNKAERIEEFVDCLDNYIQALADNRVYDNAPGNPEDSCAGCYPPNNSKKMSGLKTALINALTDIL